MKNIYRAENKCNFTKIGNKLMNSGLSADCIVIMVEYLTKPDNYKIYKNYLQKKYNWHYRRVTEAFNELIEKGYMLHFQVKPNDENPSGIMYCLYEDPIQNSL